MSENIEDILYPGIEQNWISSNQDRNYQIIKSSQEINLYDSKIPIYYEVPGPEFKYEDFILTEKSTKCSEEESVRELRKELFKTRKYLRGRKRKSSIDIGKIKIHDKKSKDNILRKFNVYFLTFVIKLANEIVAYFGFKGKFFYLDYNFKKNITKEWLKKLKSFTFGELLCKNISKKYTKHSLNENMTFYGQVVKNENIKQIFSKKYAEIFDIFRKNQRNFKVGDDDFYLSPAIKMFDAFLLSIKNKSKNDAGYIEAINEVIKDYEETISAKN